MALDHGCGAQPRQERAVDELLAPERDGMSENKEATTIAANALVKKRADLLFEISQREREIERLQTELVHLDAVLRMFRPDFKAEQLPVRHRRPTKSPYFRHGELTQRIFDALRQHGTVSSADVAVEAMRDKGLDPTTDPVTRTDFVRRVGLQLNALKQEGKVERIGKGSTLRWQLTGTN
jgi:hypothetical protein